MRGDWERGGAPAFVHHVREQKARNVRDNNGKILIKMILIINTAVRGDGALGCLLKRGTKQFAAFSPETVLG